ncbi:NAD(P)/FAD-dependent oxidoreductase [Limnobacter parvus]|uniref:NAD(P)/FAD-dependent oxidoreductase n=1 Tax=Limnobacter parvus TaxID=2939690 RepID=A0ABT1XLT3_9BURK|nr:NAD(P)/FAD-dependent oxidoreductase [Limnobacter parvus]MCR2747826.1 NAD(P)/FAD-dependent oxidoreductase [Limnobacter parvus]
MDLSSVVIVGGGAGGLELACKLGRKLGPDRVVLVDPKMYHIWKPSLHEVAAGTLDIHQEGLSYPMLAHNNGFNFVLGSMMGLDATNKTVNVAAVTDDAGDEVLPARVLSFGTLVIAVGSQSNYFGVKGAQDYTISLDGPQQAENFRLKMLKHLATLDMRKKDQPDASLDIVIIGAGATGVELAAELREASHVHSRYGFSRIDAAKDVTITLLEGAPTILHVLPESVSSAALTLLQQRHIKVVNNCRVVEISAKQVEDAHGNRYKADLCVWAAGIKAPAWLANLGLPVNRNGQLEVQGDLRVKGQSDIFSLGDCAACEQPDGSMVPPRAQSAHQQADYIYQAILSQEKGKSATREPYLYKDHGSLVSLGSRSSVGSLMGGLFKSSSMFVEGFFARTMYASLHLMHHYAVLGGMKTVLLALARFLVKRATPLVKLH